MNKFPTPSQYYRKRRPEYFSDSKIQSKVILPREQLAYEISQISINQKHDSFETLCRRLAEKLITPNLIPQVGPTGGGDGKTDSETYPVSNFISDRWFISDNKWNENENWAFAMSAKTDWKPKVKSDVKSIIGTNRGYTKIYFFSNQKISSKNKKETQDQVKKDYNIELTILDAEWIIEKVYSNYLLNDVIECLNLSTVYLEEKVIGANDAERIEELSDLEKNINKTDRYFEVDFQLVEDCLESATLSRMLELPKAEVLGKFERAMKFANKLNNPQQIIRIHYQKAWTLINWYDDYLDFFKEFSQFRLLVHKEPNIDNIELYLNLYNILKTISNLEEVKEIIEIDFFSIEKMFLEMLEECSVNENKPSSALLSKFYICFINISNNIVQQNDVSNDLIKLKEYFEKSRNHLDVPFDQLKTIIDIYSEVLPANKEFDDLTDVIAEIEASRVSEKVAGKRYLNRGIVKLENNLNKDSLIFFGKAVRKLAKEETQNEFYLCLLFLSNAYSNLGLYWAANNSLISAINLYANNWYTTGTIHPRFLRGVEQLLRNEIIIGRLPVILCWYELFSVLKKYFQNENDDEIEEMPTENLIDGCLSTRLSNISFEQFNSLQFLPDILNESELWLSSDTTLYLLGNEDLIELDSSQTSLTKDRLSEFYNKVANQPFKEQIAYETNFLDKEEVVLSAKILGAKINIIASDDYSLLILSETILAYLESFLATSFDGIFPLAEKIYINIYYDEIDTDFKINSEVKDTIKVSIKKRDSLDKKSIHKLLEELVIQVIGNNYVFKDYKTFFENLYKNDEVQERLALILEHRNFLTNILTSKPKYFFRDWKNNSQEYILKRKSNPIQIVRSETTIEKEEEKKPNIDKITHQNIKAETVIDSHLWDKAEWRAFGSFAMSTIPFGIILSFENAEAAKKIFENWIKEYGRSDINNVISITIIKGINKENPYWYKVLISKKIDKKEFKDGEFIFQSSKFHKMTPDNSDNIDKLITGYERFKKYLLVPAHVDNDLNMTPFPELGILKTELNIINAWEIGVNDFERAAIMSDDNPIIPNDIIDVPILEVLKQKKE